MSDAMETIHAVATFQERAELGGPCVFQQLVLGACCDGAWTAHDAKMFARGICFGADLRLQPGICVAFALPIEENDMRNTVGDEAATAAMKAWRAISGLPETT
jgi:hypothetical protein